MPTWFFMALTFAALVGIDIWLMATERETYSERIRFWGKVWAPSRLLIAAGFGLLLGHLYW
jgi:hypothetical protein